MTRQPKRIHIQVQNTHLKEGIIEIILKFSFKIAQIFYCTYILTKSMATMMLLNVSVLILNSVVDECIK